ncbi:MAG: metallophosphoesterase family protein [Dehalococcoidales bacterium]|nr:metallophosphoesterase family protein [Dehalococcoidales bacterium]
MKIAVLSDIHSNSLALKAVLRDIDNISNLDDVWCLGDILGYGPDPLGSFSALAQYNPLAIKGEMDQIIATEKIPAYITGDVKEAIYWISTIISPEQKEFLMKLPEKVANDEFTLVHGSPRLPLKESIVANGIANANLNYFNTRYCLAGRSCEAGMFVKLPGANCEYKKLEDGQIYDLSYERMIINPGSVGSPVDHDPRASYGVLDINNMTWEHHRVEYDHEMFMKQVQEVGFPYDYYLKTTRGE